MFSDDEWTQQELFQYKKELAAQGREVVLVDTVLKPIEGSETVTYNPYELKKYPKDTIFVFYCDTGKSTKERLSFYQKKLEGYKCVSLKGGRGYWRPYMATKDA